MILHLQSTRENTLRASSDLRIKVSFQLVSDHNLTSWCIYCYFHWELFLVDFGLSFGGIFALPNYRIHTNVVSPLMALNSSSSLLASSPFPLLSFPFFASEALQQNVFFPHLCRPLSRRTYVSLICASFLSRRTYDMVLLPSTHHFHTLVRFGNIYGHHILSMDFSWLPIVVSSKCWHIQAW